MSRPIVLLAALLLAVSLSGCATAKMDVRARNQTQAPVTVEVWITQPQETPWHRVATVPPGGEVALGVFTGPSHNDYAMLAVAGALRAERTGQQLGSSYPFWTIEVHPDRIEDVLAVY